MLLMLTDSKAALWTVLNLTQVGLGTRHLKTLILEIVWFLSDNVNLYN